MFVDATQTYLRTIFEFEEEWGWAPRRADVHARLGLTRSAVSQLVTRLVRDGLADLSGSRVLLSAAGREAARTVVRKHRVAELLLVELVGLEWWLADAEAERWQHVLGDDTERKVMALLGMPRTSPYGCVIPAVGELFGIYEPRRGTPDPVTVAAAGVVGPAPVTARIGRILESVQGRRDLLRRLHAVDAVPGRPVRVERGSTGAGVRLGTPRGTVDLDATEAASVRVVALAAAPPTAVTGRDPSGDLMSAGAVPVRAE